MNWWVLTLPVDLAMCSKLGLGLSRITRDSPSQLGLHTDTFSQASYGSIKTDPDSPGWAQHAQLTNSYPSLGVYKAFRGGKFYILSHVKEIKLICFIFDFK